MSQKYYKEQETKGTLQGGGVKKEA